MFGSGRSIDLNDERDDLNDVDLDSLDGNHSDDGRRESFHGMPFSQGSNRGDFEFYVTSCHLLILQICPQV